MCAVKFLSSEAVSLFWLCSGCTKQSMLALLVLEEGGDNHHHVYMYLGWHFHGEKYMYAI